MDIVFLFLTWTNPSISFSQVPISCQYILPVCSFPKSTGTVIFRVISNVTHDRVTQFFCLQHLFSTIWGIGAHKPHMHQSGLGPLSDDGKGDWEPISTTVPPTPTRSLTSSDWSKSSSMISRELNAHASYASS